MKRKLLFAMLCIVSVLGMRAQMTDVTSTYIDNPGFETDDAASDLTGESTQNTPTGWTISPSSLNYTQWGTANSSTTIQGNSTSQAPSAGDKYFYFRDNWQNGTNISVSQNSKAEVPAGNYVIYVDVFTYSSNKTQPVYSFTVGDGSTTYVNGSIDANKKAWATYYYHFKLDAAATLTFSANMTPKAAESGKHDWLLIDNIKLLKADNPATPIADNTADLYFYNEVTGQYLSAGASWGTHAIVDNTGQPITAKLSNGIYTLATQEYGKYVSGLYMDSGVGNWLLLETSDGSGKYYMTQDGVNYMTSNGAGAELINVTSPTDASVWTIVSKADRKTALSSATIETPANATFLLADPNFGRNNTAYSSWSWTFPNGENKDNSGDNTNFVVECYHKQFTFKQTLAAGTVPVGVYSLTAQGFYRQDGSDNEHLPVFYTNSEEQNFPVRSGSENSMTDASTSFKAGNYTIEPIYIRIEDSDAFEIGAKLATNESLWCIWDNFQLQYYGDVTVAAVKMKAYVDAYNAAMDEAETFIESSMFASDWSTLQTAISDNTLDLNDPSLTESALTTATANLLAANAAATAAVTGKTNYNTAVSLIDGGTNVDLTSLIVNPGFEQGNTNGWTNSGSIGAQAQGNSSFDNKQGSYYAERWHVSGTIDLNQTIAYLPAGVYKVEAYMYSDVADAKFYANSEEVSVSTSRKYHVVVTIADKNSIKIGGSCTLTGSTWICIDDFKLTYLAASIAELPYTLATGKLGTDKLAAQATAEEAFTDNPTLDTYNALLEAINAAEASKANYTALKTAIDKAEAVKEANNFVTADATTAFTNEITTASNAWTNVTYTDAQATNEAATLGSTVSGWHAIANEGAAGAYIASAWGKTSENWWDAPYINTWSTEGDNDGTGFSVPFFEYFANADQNLPAKTMTATLTGLENGRYQVEIWARVQRRSDADFNGDNSMITMNVNGGEAVSIMNGSTTVGTGGSTMRLGRFTAEGEVTDGTLTLSIDVKLGANVHWLSWRDVKYTKLNEANMTIAAGKYGTFVAPFDVTIPDGVTAEKVTGVSSSTLVTEAVETTIPANTPVLVSSEAAVNTTFYGKGDAVGTVKPDGQLLTGVYEAVEIPAGSYVLQTQDGVQAFYKLGANATANTVNRAYLTVPASPVKAFFFNSDDADAIKSIEATDDENTVIYNLAGERVSKAQKGLYIQKGKKMLVK